MLNIPFDNTYARELEGLYLPFEGAAAPAPRMVLLNTSLAQSLGLDPEALESPDGLAMLSGSAMPAGATPLAMAYAGHQFGSFSPQLGDGRALLVGEVIDRAGQRRDLHLKGSGRTPFARGGDGKAVLGPVLREYILGEAMAGLGIPTTRALAAVTTGETVQRETPLPGAVLARVAASHLRVGTFQFFLARGDHAALRRLTEYAIARHDPSLCGRTDRYLGFLDAVIERQLALVAQWMAVGFVHGVMNTDNCTVSGETIDYGPCAFLDHYDPDAVFSSIDRQGRYAYGRQPLMIQWNLARLAESMLPLLSPENPEAAVPEVQALIESAPGRYLTHWQARMGAKLGLTAPGEAGDEALINDFLALLALTKADFTQSFRSLGQAARGEDSALPRPLRESEALKSWLERWRARLDAPEQAARQIETVNPLYIPRNHLVEDALSAAQTGDLGPTLKLLEAVSQPYTERPGLDGYTLPAPGDFGPYTTYCGT